jgi:hypothetical protein
VAGQQHGVESAVKPRILDPRTHRCRATDLSEHVRRVVYRDHRVAKVEQSVRYPAIAATEVEDGRPAGSAAWLISGSPAAGNSR